MPNEILLVEDDAMIASGLCYALEQEGYAVCRCQTIQSSREAIKVRVFDLALLDMQLPDGIGFDISAQLTAAGTSVIFLTVVDDEGNIVKAFESGAEDYVTKPFRLRELMARVMVSITLPPFEVKQPSGKLTEIQSATIRRINEAKGIACKVTSVEEVSQIIRQLQKDAPYEQKGAIPALLAESGD